MYTRLAVSKLQKLGFYCDEPVFKTSFTEEPTGEFDFDAYLESQSRGDSRFWRTKVLVSQSGSQKKLIVTWSNNDDLDLSLFDLLLNNSFELYFSTSTGLVKAANTKHARRILGNILPLSPQRLVPAIINAKLNPNEIKILDYFVMRELRGRDPKFIFLKDFSNASLMRINHFIQSIQKKTIGIMFADGDDSFESDNPILRTLFEQMILNCHITKLHFEKDFVIPTSLLTRILNVSAINTISAEFIEVGSLELLNFISSCENLKKLSLHTIDGFSFESFKSIPQFNQLCKLKIKNLYVIRDVISIIPTLSNLESLYLTFPNGTVEINTEQIVLFSHCRQLKKLSLKYFDIEDSDISDGFSFPLLTKLTLKKCLFSSTFLARLLQASNCTTLKLISVRSTGGDFDLEKPLPLIKLLLINHFDNLNDFQNNQILIDKLFTKIPQCQRLKILGETFYSRIPDFPLLRRFDTNVHSSKSEKPPERFQGLTTSKVLSSNGQIEAKSTLKIPIERLIENKYVDVTANILKTLDFTKILFLSIEGKVAIDDLAYCLNHLPQLIKLELGGQIIGRNLGLKIVLKELIWLLLSDETKIEPECLLELLSFCPHLKKDTDVYLKFFDKKNQKTKKLSIIDGKTKNDGSVTKNATQYFRCKPNSEQPSPHEYRLEVLCDIDDDGALVKADGVFVESQIPSLSFLEIRQLYNDCFENDYTHFYGQFKFRSDEETVLPSLSPEENIIHYASNRQIKLSYDIINNFYVVKAVPGEKTELITFEYIVSIRNPELHLNSDVKRLIDYCRSFDDKELIGINRDSTPSQILAAIINQKQGSCRHRSYAFLMLAKQYLPGLPLRLSKNQIHMRVEIKYNDNWHIIDLGGYTSLLNITPLLLSDSLTMDQYEAYEDKMDLDEPSPSEEDILLSESVEPNSFFLWDRHHDTTWEDFSDYFMWLFQKAISLKRRNIFITLDNREQLEEFNIAAMKYCKEINKNHFFIDNLDHIYTRSLVLTDTVQWQIADSQLKNFLKQADLGDVLIMNWEQYGPQHIGLNSFLDEQRQYQDIKINNSVIIICALSPEVASQMGEDFYSRGEIFPNPDLVDSNITIKPTLKQTPPDYENSINLFNDLDWKADFIGTLHFAGRNMKFLPAALINALQTNKTALSIVNAPNDSAFRIFYHHLVYKRQFDVYGKTYTIPADFEFSFSNSTYNIKVDTNTSSWDVPLNDSTYNYFYKNVTCYNNQLFNQPGWLEANKNSSLTILVSEDCSESHLAKLKAKADTLNCRVNFTKANYRNISQPFNLGNIDQQRISIINSQDVTFTKHLLENLQSLKTASFIAVHANTSYSDLVGTFKPMADSELGNFEFHEGPITLALRERKSIILYGYFSKVLLGHLETLLNDFLMINGKIYKLDREDRIIFVCSNVMPYPYYANQYKHEINENDYWPYLSSSEKVIDSFRNDLTRVKEFWHPRSFAQCKELLRNKLSQPQKNYFKPFLLLEKNAQFLLVQTNNLFKERQDKMDLDKENDDIIKSRFRKIFDKLLKHRYVFMVGESGTGKSTLIIDELIDYVLENRDQAVSLFFSMRKILPWVRSTQPGLKILFLDEANLEPESNYDLFEGLYEQTNGFYYAGTFCKPSEDHFIIAAGNYQDFPGRYPQRFFSGHGSVVLIKPLPNNFLKQMLTGLLEKGNLFKTEIIEHAIQFFLDIFNYLDSQYRDKKINFKLTPRNLQMMVFRLWLFCQERAYYSETIKVLIIPVAVSMELSTYTIPQEIIGDLFDRFKLYDEFVFNKHFSEAKYALTESRLPCFELMSEFLAIRKIKLKQGGLTKYGVNGLLIEGESGIGKSLMIEAFLESEGYVDGNDHPEAPDDIKYYRITPTDFNQMQALCQMVFHQGSILVADEFNTLFLESILNHLMSGVDVNGQRAEKEGFCVFATQNPVTYAKRQTLSEAAENRFQLIKLPPYPERELKAILDQRGINEELSKKYIKEYLIARAFAEKYDKKPKPTPRDLFSFLRNKQRDEVSSEIQSDEEEQPSKLLICD